MKRVVRATGFEDLIDSGSRPLDHPLFPLSAHDCSSSPVSTVVRHHLALFVPGGFLQAGGKNFQRRDASDIRYSVGGEGEGVVLFRFRRTSPFNDSFIFGSFCTSLVVVPCPCTCPESLLFLSGKILWQGVLCGAEFVAQEACNYEDDS